MTVNVRGSGDLDGVPRLDIPRDTPLDPHGRLPDLSADSPIPVDGDDRVLVSDHDLPSRDADSGLIGDSGKSLPADGDGSPQDGGRLLTGREETVGPSDRAGQAAGEVTPGENRPLARPVQEAGAGLATGREAAIDGEAKLDADAAGEPDSPLEPDQEDRPGVADSDPADREAAKNDAGNGRKTAASPNPPSGGALAAPPADSAGRGEQTALPTAPIEGPAARPIGSTAAGPAALQIPAGQTPPAPVQQIMVALEKLGTGDRINLRLDPPDLGIVTIRLEVSDGAVRAIVAAERPDIVDLLVRHRGELSQILAESGFEDAETQIDLEGREFGRKGRNHNLHHDGEPDGTRIDVPSERADWQGRIARDGNGMKDGRLDIRV